MLDKNKKVILVKKIKIFLKKDKASADINIKFENNKDIDISKAYILPFY